MSERACSPAAMVSGAAYPLVCISAFRSAAWSLSSSRRNAGVAGRIANWLSARVRCSTASTSAERSSDRCPALPHRPAAFSVPGVGAVMSQQLGLTLGDLHELALEDFGNAG